MRNSKFKAFESVFLGVGYTFILLLSYFTLLFTIVWTKDLGTPLTSTNEIIFIFMTGILPTIIWVTLIHRGFSIIKIDENGLEKSLFKIFYKREIKWKEIVDYRIIVRVERRIYLSKIPMGNLTYRKILNNKNIIHLPITKEIVELIEKYTSFSINEIVN